MKRKIGGLARRFLAVSVVMALCVPTIGAPFAYAADTPFSGGPIAGSAPTIVPNDHTPQAVRFSGTGLDVNSTYYVKVRLTLSPDPSTGGGGANHRGYVWNRVTGEWVRNRGEDWSKYPTVETDGSGTIKSTGDANWLFFKFGNENNSGLYYLNITLNKGGVDGSSRNSDTPLPVNVVDMKTAGGWLHNGTATGAEDFKRVSLNDGTSSGSTNQVLSIHRTELNQIDDDSNRLVDDEDYGPEGAQGDWRLAAPATATVDPYIQTNLQGGGNFEMKDADQDIAFGAGDTTAPSAPQNLSAAAGPASIVLEWDESSDDTGVEGYRVYRWVDVSSVEYTPVHELVGTVGEGTFTDTDITKGVTYNYEVRAFDGATNVSARSTSALAVVIPPPPAVTAQVTPGSPNGANGWYSGIAPTIALSTDGDAFYAWAESGPFAAYTGPIKALEGQNTLYYYAEGDFGVQSETYELPLKVDSLKPTAKVTVPAFVTRDSYHQSYDVKWSGSDGTESSGGLKYDVEYKINAGGSWKRWRTDVSYTKALNTGSVGRTYYWRARAKDAAGNVGGWSSAGATTIPYDNVSMSFGKGWKTKTSPEYYLGSMRRAASKASASMSFRGGTAAYLVTSTGPNRGKVKVYIDGKYRKTISLYSSKVVNRKDIKLDNLSGSSKKRHTVRLVTVPVSGRRYVPVDGLAVRR